MVDQNLALEKMFQRWDLLEVQITTLLDQEVQRLRLLSIQDTKLVNSYYPDHGLVAHLRELQSEQDLV